MHDHTIKLEDFDVIRFIAQGKLGHIYLVRYNTTYSATRKLILFAHSNASIAQCFLQTRKISFKDLDRSKYKVFSITPTLYNSTQFFAMNPTSTCSWNCAFRVAFMKTWNFKVDSPKKRSAVLWSKCVMQYNICMIMTSCTEIWNLKTFSFMRYA